MSEEEPIQKYHRKSESTDENNQVKAKREKTQETLLSNHGECYEIVFKLT